MSVTLHTSHGPLKFELFCHSAPLACRNFLALCASGAYNETVFTRNISGFMIQGGSIDRTLKSATPAQSIYASNYFADEVTPEHRFDRRGVLAMAARSGQPNTNCMQFFITYKEAPHLNNVNTIFGQLLHRSAQGSSDTADDETLACLERLPVDDKHRPIKPIKIQSVDIHANPFAEANEQTDGLGLR